MYYGKDYFNSPFSGGLGGAEGEGEGALGEHARIEEGEEGEGE